MIYFDISNTKFGKTLIENYQTILKDCETLFAIDGPVEKINAVMHTQDGRNLESIGKQKYTGKNASLHIRVVPELLDIPERKIALSPGAEENRERRRKICKNTVEILKPFWNDIGNIGFNRLYPGAVITPHYGTLGAVEYVRVHLGLSCDNQCTFYARGYDSYTWKDGELMAFDDAEAFHWVEHKGEQPRTILCIDIKRSAVGL